MMKNVRGLSQSGKRNFSWVARLQLGLVVWGSFCLLGEASANVVYWDQNQATSGFQTTTSSGTWNTDAFWTLDPAGNSGPWSAAVSGDDFVFVSGLNNSNNTPINLSADLAANSLTLRNGRWSFAGTGGTRTLTLGSGGLTWEVPIGGTAGGGSTFANTISVVLNGTQSWTSNVNNGTNNLTVNGAIAGNATTGNTNTLTLTGNSFNSGFTLGGVVSDGSAGGRLAITINNSVNALTATDSTYQINNVGNSYSGKTTVQSGFLRVASITSVGGGNSSLGSVTTVADGTIDLGSGTSTGGLVFNGSGASTSDRVINLAGTTGGGVILNSSSALGSSLTLSSGIVNSGGGNKTFTLGGTNAGNNTISGVIGDAVDLSKTALSKKDAGLWNLIVANTYTGGTTISGGTLSIGAAGTLGANVVGNNITIAGGNLLLSSAGNIGSNQNITITSAGGGIGVSYDPVSFPSITDNSGSTGGVFGINYTGTGGIGSLAGINALFTPGSNWFLGSFVGGSGTYTGTSLTAGNGNTYRLGGGGGALTVQNDILTGANNLIVGSTGGGAVTLSNGNTFTGTTTLQNGTLHVSSINRVAGGSASSSLGAPVSEANGTITIGSGANAVGLNYTGSGETTDRILRFNGTTGSITLGNSGTGDVIYTSAPVFSGSGAKTLLLGNTTDSRGGTLGRIVNNGGNTSVVKQGLTNSRWVLTGTGLNTNTHSGNTQITGGVLQTATASDLASSYVQLSGSGLSNLAVWQTQGTLTRTLSASVAASNLNWASNSGFAAKGGTLTLNISGGAALTWGTGNFMGTGGAPLVFGSSTADGQVVLSNNINLNTPDAFSRVIHVEKGLGGDSALLSGVISPGAGATGLTKDGNGMLILSGTNTYTGTTIIRGGTLVAANDSALGNATSAITLGTAETTSNNYDASLLIGGANTINRAISIANQATTGIYSVGGSTDNSATFSGLVTAAQNFKVTQVATTSTNALNITGGITGGATAAAKIVNFDNVGAVNVNTTGISNGAGGGTMGILKTNSGTTTINTVNTYTGSTTVSGGTLLIGGGGNINSTSGVTVNAGGTFRYNSATAYAGGAINNNGGAIAGSGNLGSTILGGTGSINPGNSPGLMTAGGTDPSAGLDYNFEFTLKNSALNYAAVENDVLRLFGGTPFTSAMDTDNILNLYLDAALYGSLADGDTLFGGFYVDQGDFLSMVQGSQIVAYYEDLSGSINYEGKNYSLLTGGGFSISTLADAEFSGSGYLSQFTYTAVPEPSTYALLGLGLGCLCFLRRKRVA